MQRDEVRGARDGGEVGGPRADRLDLWVSHKRIVHEHASAQGDALAGHLAADLAKSDHAYG